MYLAPFPVSDRFAFFKISRPRLDERGRKELLLRQLSLCVTHVLDFLGPLFFELWVHIRINDMNARMSIPVALPRFHKVFQSVAHTWSPPTHIACSAPPRNISASPAAKAPYSLKIYTPRVFII